MFLVFYSVLHFTRGKSLLISERAARPQPRGRGERATHATARRLSARGVCVRGVYSGVDRVSR